jgi:hypothetical protein
MSELIITQAQVNWQKEIRVNKDGTSYFSIRAVARLAGVDQSQLTKNLKSGEGSLPVKMAEHLISKGFEGEGFSNCGRTGVPDRTAAAIIRYYAMYAGSYCTNTARQSLEAMSELGIRTFAHKLTGWSAADNSIAAYLEKALPATPHQWECRFKPEFWAALERLYGLKRGQQACGMFIAHWVYGWFPLELQERLKEINPVIGPGYQRRNRHHQHFEAMLDLALDMHISKITTNLIRAVNRNHFKRLMADAPRVKFKDDPLLNGQ